MNSKYFELLQAREECLQRGDDESAEALWNAAIEIAKLGIFHDKSGVRINSETYDKPSCHQETLLKKLINSLGLLTQTR